ncbi:MULTISPECIES: Arc family DNA-binding protein [Halomonas]|uniref:Arc family DNA-binding protein n=1 Tax=Halomonas TaxID=2745 RepID=UPI001C958F16|nr:MULTISPECIES: Arc family DNA-binding protein [Halomonas]MBY6208784.1 Arc family DNA-binding protein [Halomonas sp. DP3Y7-2]MBY6227254.1 Arc family DNA-binding protein [Halomonas sp. DP3Y7-1]MCA0914996.1 Arc family DNA-binding protein [Halomonas denitrificans]
MDNRTDPQYKLRMPPELRDKLKEAAKENHRTMNAEIIARLEASYGSSSISSDEGARALHEARQRLDALKAALDHALHEYDRIVRERTK